MLVCVFCFVACFDAGVTLLFSVLICGGFVLFAFVFVGL